MHLFYKCGHFLVKSSFGQVVQERAEGPKLLAHEGTFSVPSQGIAWG